MSKIREVLRLKCLNNISNRQIQILTGVSRNSVSNYMKIYEQLDSKYDEIIDLNDQDLEDLFHPKKQSKVVIDKQKVYEPNWNEIHQELTKKGMTRKLLYEELKESNPNIYSYSQFNRNLKRFTKTINPSMRQIHYGGDKLFIDYSGLTMPITDATTGEVTKAQIFVSVLAASGYTFVDATASQSTKDFIQSHVKAFEFYGYMPNILMPDNLKAAVISHKRGVVRLNDSYSDMGRYYDVAIEPARPRKPQDKSKVELGVKAIQRWILAKLRNHVFFDVDELNQQINKLIDGYNSKVIRRLGKSRTELFELLDKPYMLPLKRTKYIYKEFKKATVGVDYHIELDGSGYSVPYQYLGRKVDVMYSSTSVVISIDGDVIAHHPKLTHKYHDSTQTAHMPSTHQAQSEKWNSRRILNWASSVGVYTTALMELIMSSKTHETRGYKACMAILSFTKRYEQNEFELMAKVAIELNIYSVSSIESMLKTKSYLSHTSVTKVSIVNKPVNNHKNIRGSKYYSQLEETRGNK